MTWEEKFSPSHARLFMRSQRFLVEMTLERATTTPTTVIPSGKPEGFEVEESACRVVVL